MLVPGPALFIAIPDSGRLVPLVETGLEELPRESLRHKCGARVVPVTSRETNDGAADWEPRFQMAKRSAVAEWPANSMCP